MRATHACECVRALCWWLGRTCVLKEHSAQTQRHTGRERERLVHRAARRGLVSNLGSLALVFWCLRLPSGGFVQSSSGRRSENRFEKDGGGTGVCMCGPSAVAATARVGVRVRMELQTLFPHRCRLRNTSFADVRAPEERATHMPSSQGRHLPCFSPRRGRGRAGEWVSVGLLSHAHSPYMRVCLLRS